MSDAEFLNWHSTLSKDEQLKTDQNAFDKDRASRTPRRLTFAGRFQQYTTGSWVGWSSNYGPAGDNWNTLMGNDDEPDIAYNQFGLYVEKGTTVIGLSMAQRANTAELNNLSMRLMFQTGDWGGSWNSSGETKRFDLLAFKEHHVDAGNSWKRYRFDMDYVAPDDGFLILAFKPNGRLSSTRYLYTTGFIDTV